MKTFDIKYLNSKFTSSKKLNFIGATIEYFDEANINVQDEFKDDYIRDYEESIFPLIDKELSMDEYDDIVIAELTNRIQTVNDYKDSTIKSRINNLINKTVNQHVKKTPVSLNFGWGRSSLFKTDKDDEEDIESSKLKIRKSLTAEEDKLAFELLINNPISEDGEYIALAIMFMSGVRNNEVTALNFGDLIEMTEHHGTYYLQVYESTKINSNIVKAGGKTYNAPRNLPVMDVLAEFILKRKQYLSNLVTFPLTGKNGELFNSINELPIGCKGNNYAERLSSKDLSNAGRDFLKNKMHMQERRVSGVSACMLESYGTEDYLDEADVTTYLFRRNAATRIYYLGFTTPQCQYYMGHDIENTELKRSDFSDESFLFELYKIIRECPLNKYDHEKPKKENEQLFVKNISSFKCNIKLKKDSNTNIAIKSKEKNDPITINANCKDTMVTIKDRLCISEFSRNVNIRKKIKNIYSL